MNDAPGSDTADAVSRSNTPAVGAQLQAAREQRELTLEQVARQLRLDVEVIEALENDTAEQLAAPIFVQGYLRSYARLLGLPESSVLSGGGTPAAPPLTIKRVKTDTPIMSLPSFRLLRNLLVVILVVLLVWLAWPLIDRVLEMRDEPAGEQSPGYLEIPPSGPQN